MIPEGIETSVWPRVERRLNEAGVFFDPWQQGFATVALGCRSVGKYAATVGGVVGSIPRQVGKTYTVGNIVIGLCIEFPGSRWIWTSHHNRTTTNTFRSFQGMVKSKKIAPHLAPGRNDGIRTANGEQEIAFRNGSIIMFGAREQGFGRGMDAIDGEVFDEAQILGLKALEDMVPATNQARHPHGGLLFFLGTPPTPNNDGEAFTIKREQAISGKSKNIVYVELSADEDADPDDREQWRRMNPSFPHRTPLESMLRMRENIPDDESWFREAMGIWRAKGGGLIPAELWAGLVDGQSAPVDPVSFGVYANRLQTNAAIGVAAYRSDGLIHVGIVPAVHGTEVDSLPGVGWIPRRLAELQEQWKPGSIVVDGYSASATLVTPMQEVGVEPDVTNATDFARACQSFYTGVMEGTIRHRGAAPLAVAVSSAKKRDLVDGFAWDRKSGAGDITQLNAVTLALHGLVNNPPQISVYASEELLVL